MLHGAPPNPQSPRPVALPLVALVFLTLITQLGSLPYPGYTQRTQASRSVERSSRIGWRRGGGGDLVSPRGNDDPRMAVHAASWSLRNSADRRLASHLPRGVGVWADPPAPGLWNRRADTDLDGVRAARQWSHRCCLWMAVLAAKPRGCDPGSLHHGLDPSRPTGDHNVSDLGATTPVDWLATPRNARPRREQLVRIAVLH